jgi:hypothetical protein
MEVAMRDKVGMRESDMKGTGYAPHSTVLASDRSYVVAKGGNFRVVDYTENGADKSDLYVPRLSKADIQALISEQLKSMTSQLLGDSNASDGSVKESEVSSESAVEYAGEKAETVPAVSDEEESAQ